MTRSAWFVLVLPLCLGACRGKEAPAPAASALTATAPAEPARDAYHEDTFDLVMKPPAKLSAGMPATVEVQLSAKGGYHVNDKYPYKFKVAETGGVKFTVPVFTKDQVTLEEKRATMKLDFTPETKGPKSIGGTFAFSLCSAERCLVEKRNLTASIAVD